MNRTVAVAAATAAVQRELCSRCQTELEYTADAIGRVRPRCPRCDGIAKPRPRHPDEVLVPQTLKTAPVTVVEVVREVVKLPPIAPGQLRCQGCGIGVPGRDRFCAECRRKQSKASARRSLLKVKPDAREIGPNQARPVLRDEEGRAICERCRLPVPRRPRGGRPPRVCEACCTPKELAERQEHRAANAQYFAKRRDGAAAARGGASA